VMLSLRSDTGRVAPDTQSVDPISYSVAGGRNPAQGPCLRIPASIGRGMSDLHEMIMCTVPEHFRLARARIHIDGDLAGGETLSPPL
jgi:hypothetical protein